MNSLIITSSSIQDISIHTILECETRMTYNVQWLVCKYRRSIRYMQR